VVNRKSKKIVCTDFSRGKKHDFKLYKHSKLSLPQTVRLDLDSAYLGIEKFHPNSRIPRKKSKLRPLTETDKKYNKILSRSRVMVEHVIRKIKIFRIIAERYRNRRKRYSLRVNLIAGLYNFEQN